MNFSEWFDLACITGAIVITAFTMRLNRQTRKIIADTDTINARLAKISTPNANIEAAVQYTQTVYDRSV